jgi:endo-1,4-beta-D-glucanase Y
MKRKTGIAALSSAALVASAVVAVLAHGASAATLSHPFPFHVTYKTGVMPSASAATRDAAVEKQYDSWKANYLHHGCASNEYYVSTKGDGDAPNNGTVSEAQGYGMNIVPLMAGYDANAKTEFDGLWQLVKDHRDSHGMMQWQLDGIKCNYTDSGTPDSATDGDLDIGYGLILADKQWGGYTADALAWLAKFYAADVTSDGHLKCEDDGPSTDSRPSDWMLDHLRAFAAYDTAHDWNKVITKTQSMIQEFTAAYSPSANLLSDFIINANTTSPDPAPASYQEDQPDNIVGYNSIRVPWHMGTDALLYGNSVSLAVAKNETKCYTTISGGDPKKVQPHIKLSCANANVSGDTQAEEAGDSAGPSAMAAGNQSFTDAVWNELGTNPFGDGYFGETIKMIVYIVMAGDYWAPGASDGTPPPPPPPTTNPPGHTTVTVEAESGTVAGGAKVASCASCSGGQKVGFVGNGGTLTLSVSSNTAGSYPLKISYLNGGSAARSATVTVNGTAQNVSFPTNGSWTTVQTLTVTVTVTAGTNTIVFSNPTAYGPDVDKVVV